MNKAKILEKLTGLQDDVREVRMVTRIDDRSVRQPGLCGNFLVRPRGISERAKRDHGMDPKVESITGLHTLNMISRRVEYTSYILELLFAISTCKAI